MYFQKKKKSTSKRQSLNMRQKELEACRDKEKALK